MPNVTSLSMASEVVKALSCASDWRSLESLSKLPLRAAVRSDQSDMVLWGVQWLVTTRRMRQFNRRRELDRERPPC